MTDNKHENQILNGSLNQDFWDKFSKIIPFDFLLLDESGTLQFKKVEHFQENLILENQKNLIDGILHVDCNEDPCQFKEFLMKQTDFYSQEFSVNHHLMIKVEAHRFVDDNKKSFILLAIQDVSDSHRVDQILKENERRLRAFLDASPDIFLTLDESGMVKSYHGNMMGNQFIPGKIIGQPIQNILKIENFRELEKLLTHSHEGDLVQSLNGQWIGEKGVTQLNIRVVPGSGKDTVLLLRDRSEIFEKEENIRLLERNASFVEIASGMNQEVVNQLMTIHSYSDILLKAEESQEKQHYLKRIKEAAMKSQSLLENLFTYSGKEVESIQEVEFNQAVFEAVSFCRFGLPDKIQLTFHESEKTMKLQLPRRQLVSMIINIIMNAREAMVEGDIQLETGTVSSDQLKKENLIGHIHKSLYYYLRIKDNGCGMTEKEMSRIFEPLYSSKKKANSTGMGLTILKNFMNQFGGLISVQSKKDEGTEFILLFPENAQAIDAFSQSILSSHGFTQEIPYAVVDPSLAIEMLEGNEDLYHTICRDFIVDYEEAVDKVNLHVSEGQWEKARIIIHSIKGLAGLVGSMELQDKSKSFEVVLKEENRDEYLVEKDGFVALLEKVMDELRKYLEKGQSDGISVSNEIQDNLVVKIPKEYMGDISDLEKHLFLAEYNQCLEILSRLNKEPVEESWTQFLINLETWIKTFEFDQAHEQVKKCIAQS